MHFRLPNDFTALTSVKVILFPITTGSFDWTANTVFAANGETWQLNSGSATADNQAGTHITYLELDISAAFAGVAANDIVHVVFTLDALHTTTEVEVVGLDVKYA